MYCLLCYRALVTELCTGALSHIYHRSVHSYQHVVPTWLPALPGRSTEVMAVSCRLVITTSRQSVAPAGGALFRRLFTRSVLATQLAKRRQCPCSDSIRACASSQHSAYSAAYTARRPGLNARGWSLRSQRLGARRSAQAEASRVAAGSNYRRSLSAGRRRDDDDLSPLPLIRDALRSTSPCPIIPLPAPLRTAQPARQRRVVAPLCAASRCHHIAPPTTSASRLVGTVAFHAQIWLHGRQRRRISVYCRREKGGITESAPPRRGSGFRLRSVSHDG